MTDFNIDLGETPVTYTKGFDEDGFPRYVTHVEKSAEATTARGDRWATGPLADEVEFTREALGTPETRPALWHKIEPVYGSEAWGPEDEYALACDEADAFGEPRPRW